MSKSVAPRERLGDLLQVVRYILTFRNYLLDNPNAISDVEYRLAIQLDQIGHMLAPSPLSQREPPYGDIINQLQTGFGRSTSPWKAPSELTSFSESYNAQTLHPSFVRRLLVDPDDEWLPKVSGKGPQVITGIRGCGKTMLLKAMQSHSQISYHFENSSGHRPGNCQHSEGRVCRFVCTRQQATEYSWVYPGPCSRTLCQTFRGICFRGVTSRKAFE